MWTSQGYFFLANLSCDVMKLGLTALKVTLQCIYLESADPANGCTTRSLKPAGATEISMCMERHLYTGTWGV